MNKGVLFVSIFCKVKALDFYLLIFFYLKIILFLGLMTIYVECRPDETPSTEKINVEDTDDEFVIKKPDSNDPTYNEFLDELYQHDKSKGPSSSKSKRFAEAGNDYEKITVDSPKEFDIPAKPEANKDENYDQFLSHLYRHDELKRSRRMIVFRHDLSKKLKSV